MRLLPWLPFWHRRRTLPSSKRHLAKSFIPALVLRSALTVCFDLFVHFHKHSLKMCICLSQAPSRENDPVRKLEVVVQGETFYSREVRKIMITAYEPMTFVQTDKPLYLPGQTGNFVLKIHDVAHNILHPPHKYTTMCMQKRGLKLTLCQNISHMHIHY